MVVQILIKQSQCMGLPIININKGNIEGNVKEFLVKKN